MSDLQEFIEFMNYSKKYKEQSGLGLRRYLRDKSDPFQKYSVEEFRTHYGFTPDAVKNIILPMIEGDLKKPTKRGLPFAPELMLLLTLRYYTTGYFRRFDGNVMGICQQSASRIIPKISRLIAQRMKHFVKFPSNIEGINTVKQKFYEIAQFPEVIGCLESTHVKIKSPGGPTSEMYKNRKGWFSINVQTVIGPNMEFFDLVARWPGSVHEGYIYDRSAVKQKLVTGALPGILLGDNRYAISNVLLTPFLAPYTRSQDMYNKSHISTRNSVKRVLGLWKKRFPCLSVGMGVKMETVMAVICACATLHNISIKLNEMSWYDDTEDYTDYDFDVNVNEDPNSNGFAARQSIVDSFFSLS